MRSVGHRTTQRLQNRNPFALVSRIPPWEKNERTTCSHTAHSGALSATRKFAARFDPLGSRALDAVVKALSPVRRVSAGHGADFRSLYLSPPIPFNPSKSPFNPEIRPFNVSYFTSGISSCYRAPCTPLPPSSTPKPASLIPSCFLADLRIPAEPFGIDISLSIPRILRVVSIQRWTTQSQLLCFLSHPYNPRVFM